MSFGFPRTSSVRYSIAIVGNRSLRAFCVTFVLAFFMDVPISVYFIPCTSRSHSNSPFVFRTILTSNEKLASSNRVYKAVTVFGFSLSVWPRACRTTRFSTASFTSFFTVRPRGLVSRAPTAESLDFLRPDSSELPSFWLTVSWERLETTRGVCCNLASSVVAVDDIIV